MLVSCWLAAAFLFEIAYNAKGNSATDEVDAGLCLMQKGAYPLYAAKSDARTVDTGLSEDYIKTSAEDSLTSAVYGGIREGGESCARCSGHGSCLADGCMCERSWAGLDCSFLLRSDSNEEPRTESLSMATVTQCQDGCGEGTCVSGTCHCPVGRFGPLCADQLCAHDCWGHGTCNAGACSCESGWFGQDCSLQESSLYEEMERLAQETVDHATVAEAVALSFEQQIAEMDGQAKEAARAKAAEEDKAMKKVAEAQAAALDAEATKAAAAINKAEQEKAAAEAKVAAAWKRSLQKRESEPTSSLQKSEQQGCTFGCSGHGDCDFTAHTCTCNAGWAGDFCDQPRCEKDCSNRGLCADSKCLCSEGFYGGHCQYIRCPSDCSGHGYCFQGSCQCSEKWSGEACSTLMHSTGSLRMSMHQKQYALAGLPDVQHSTLHAPAVVTKCQDSCSNRGSCVHGICSCQPGFYGPSCASSSCCSGHGSCAISPENCECDEGWGGLDCSMELACVDEFCSGRGTCVHGKCNCSLGFGGLSCQLVMKARKPSAVRKGHILTLLQQKSHASLNQSAYAGSPMTSSWIPLMSRDEQDDRTERQSSPSSRPISVLDFLKRAGDSTHNSDLTNRPDASLLQTAEQHAKLLASATQEAGASLVEADRPEQKAEVSLNLLQALRLSSTRNGASTRSSMTAAQSNEPLREVPLSEWG